MNATKFFGEYFERLKRTAPYPWQRKLFEQIVLGNWPDVVDMPTGAGKTAVLWIWWLALVWSKQEKTNGIPIRLAWVVNRRVVVDQVTEECRLLCDKWREIGVHAMPEPPAVSTLRGALADNGDWRNDPTKPAVIVGTVDMIGSRLLFRGYRSSPYWRPVESGLLGVDTLIVNDEAHLSPAFSKLIRALERMKPAERIHGKSFRYMLLSATQDKDTDAVRFDHDPEADAIESDHFDKVWKAAKVLTLREAANAQQLKSEFWKLATQEPAPRTIVFIDRPEEALEFYKRLINNGHTAALMTGTMRGKERDELTEQNVVFSRFIDTNPAEGRVFLIATSAAEVGVNLTCERMVTGLCEVDHLIQRFGRLNRFGATNGGQPIRGEAYVLYIEPQKEKRLKATIKYLQSLEGDVSPRKLWARQAPDEALSVKPKVARLERWRIESWAQTSYRDHDLPSIEPWLRGMEDAAPQTEIAWRADLECLRSWEIPNRQIEQVLGAFPVLAKERLQEPTDRVLDKLGKVKGKLGEAPDWVLIVQADQSVRWKRLAELSGSDIQYCLVLFPEHIGRVEQHGMFEPDTGDEQQKDISTSVAERVRVVITESEARYLGESYDSPAPGDAEAVRTFAKEHEFRAPLMIRNPENRKEMLVYLTKRSAKSKKKLAEVPLEEHQREVAAYARKLAMNAGLNDLADCYFRAGLLHDEGKDHPLWQKAMGATNPPAAKTVGNANLSLLGGYRHEFKSLRDAAGKDDIDDLLLHLIATHHAKGRPFFDADAYGPLSEKAECERVARDAEQRFARLQYKFGTWGLAYIEAIFKRSDGLASAEEGDGASE